MKKVICSIFVLALAGSITVSAASNSDQTYKGYSVIHVQANQKAIQSDVPGINMDGTSMVPLRVIAEALGAEVEWNGETSTVLISTTQAPPAQPAQQKPDPSQERIEHIYQSLHNELEDIDHLIEQTQMAKDLYMDLQETRQLDNIENIKLKKVQSQYKEIHSKIIDLQDKYPEQSKAVEQFFADLKQLDLVIADYQTALDQLIRYTDESSERAYLRNYYMYLMQASDKLYELKTDITGRTNTILERFDS